MSLPSRERLPAAAIAALRRGNKIEAIKLVRAAETLDLKDSKQRVDRYLAGDAGVRADFERNAKSGGAALFWLAVFAALATAAWFLLAR